MHVQIITMLAATDIRSVSTNKCDHEISLGHNDRQRWLGLTGRLVGISGAIRAGPISDRVVKPVAPRPSPGT
jgi:hypothetical protein